MLYLIQETCFNEVIMSVFYGSKDDFIKYIGGYCKNKIPIITRDEKKRYGNICTCCGQKSELQAAHVHGFERLQIIEDILNENFKEDDIYNVDLDEFERIFIENIIQYQSTSFFYVKIVIKNMIQI